MNLLTPKAGAEHEILFNKPAAGVSRRLSLSICQTYFHASLGQLNLMGVEVEGLAPSTQTVEYLLRTPRLVRPAGFDKLTILLSVKQWSMTFLQP
jgi:hypothetical protein